MAHPLKWYLMQHMERDCWLKWVSGHSEKVCLDCEKYVKEVRRRIRNTEQSVRKKRKQSFVNNLTNSEKSGSIIKNKS